MADEHEETLDWGGEEEDHPRWKRGSYPNSPADQDDEDAVSLGDEEPPSFETTYPEDSYASDRALSPPPAARSSPPPSHYRRSQSRTVVDVDDSPRRSRGSRVLVPRATHALPAKPAHADEAIRQMEQESKGQDPNTPLHRPSRQHHRPTHTRGLSGDAADPDSIAAWENDPKHSRNTGRDNGDAPYDIPRHRQTSSWDRPDDGEDERGSSSRARPRPGRSSFSSEYREPNSESVSRSTDVRIDLAKPDGGSYTRLHSDRRQRGLPRGIGGVDDADDLSQPAISSRADYHQQYYRGSHQDVSQYTPGDDDAAFERRASSSNNHPGNTNRNNYGHNSLSSRDPYVRHASHRNRDAHAQGPAGYASYSEDEEVLPSRSRSGRASYYQNPPSSVDVVAYPESYPAKPPSSLRHGHSSPPPPPQQQHRAYPAPSHANPRAQSAQARELSSSGPVNDTARRPQSPVLTRYSSQAAQYAASAAPNAYEEGAEAGKGMYANRQQQQDRRQPGYRPQHRQQRFHPDADLGAQQPRDRLDEDAPERQPAAAAQVDRLLLPPEQEQPQAEQGQQPQQRMRRRYTSDAGDERYAQGDKGYVRPANGRYSSRYTSAEGRYASSGGERYLAPPDRQYTAPDGQYAPSEGRYPLVADGRYPPAKDARYAAAAPRSGSADPAAEWAPRPFADVPSRRKTTRAYPDEEPLLRDGTSTRLARAEGEERGARGNNDGRSMRGEGENRPARSDGDGRPPRSESDVRTARGDIEARVARGDTDVRVARGDVDSRPSSRIESESRSSSRLEIDSHGPTRMDVDVRGPSRVDETRQAIRRRDNPTPPAPARSQNDFYGHREELANEAAQAQAYTSGARSRYASGGSGGRSEYVASGAPRGDYVASGAPRGEYVVSGTSRGEYAPGRNGRGGYVPSGTRAEYATNEGDGARTDSRTSRRPRHPSGDEVSSSQGRGISPEHTSPTMKQYDDEAFERSRRQKRPFNNGEQRHHFHQDREEQQNHEPLSHASNANTMPPAKRPRLSAVERRFAGENVPYDEPASGFVPAPAPAPSAAISQDPGQAAPNAALVPPMTLPPAMPPLPPHMQNQMPPPNVPRIHPNPVPPPQQQESDNSWNRERTRRPEDTNAADALPLRRQSRFGPPVATDALVPAAAAAVATPSPSSRPPLAASVPPAPPVSTQKSPLVGIRSDWTPQQRQHANEPAPPRQYANEPPPPPPPVSAATLLPLQESQPRRPIRGASPVPQIGEAYGELDSARGFAAPQQQQRQQQYRQQRGEGYYARGFPHGNVYERPQFGTEQGQEERGSWNGGAGGGSGGGGGGGASLLSRIKPQLADRFDKAPTEAEDEQGYEYGRRNYTRGGRGGGRWTHRGRGRGRGRGGYGGYAVQEPERVRE